MAVDAQGELTNRSVGERLVKLGKIRSGIAPVLAAARQSAKTMEELYHGQNIKDPIYHDMKAIIGPLERLAQRVDDEIEKNLKKLTDTEITDPPLDQSQNEGLVRDKLKRQLRSLG